MRYYKEQGLDLGDFVITKREAIASVFIIAVMFILGCFISSSISDAEVDRNEKYNKAIKIENAELFQYGMDTNVGNAFVYGELEAVDSVTFPEIGGEYMYVEKIKEEYTMHTRTVTYTDSNGKTKTKTEIYWSWDYVGREDKTSKEISFCGIVFDRVKFEIPSSHYIDTIKESSHIRYVYYGTDLKHTGTIFTELKDKTISDETRLYKDQDIQETLDRLQSSFAVPIFWILWIIVTVACVFGFYYIDNRWLED